MRCRAGAEPAAADSVPDWHPAAPGGGLPSRLHGPAGLLLCWLPCLRAGAAIDLTLCKAQCANKLCMLLVAALVLCTLKGCPDLLRIVHISIFLMGAWDECINRCSRMVLELAGDVLL